MIKTIVVDDDRKFLQRINSFLFSDESIEVVGEAYNGRNVIKLCKELQPDLVIMDIRMPVMDGVQATKEVTDKFPDIKVIVLTVFDFKEYREASMNAGASAYILKKKMYTDLLLNIHQLCENTDSR
ncbi:MAG: response regulator transcription factor [Candidatus Neomarinimicrobiota bacterium]